ncbi:MAG: M18 family aminopeptidase, partial [Clostridium sp.]|nr:M18 family aminopeptidase [Clostridium sp.]
MIMKKEAFETAEKCLDFIDKSVSSFHAVANVEKCLAEAGFTELRENKSWELKRGKGYFVKRNDSSLIAFKLPEQEAEGFHITASHSDSPAFKVKTKAEIPVEDHYVKLNVEPYGGMIYASWLDRCLSVAGRVICRGENGLESRTVSIDEDLLIIPNLAIHMDREMNKALSYNPQVDLQPLMSAWEEEEEGSILMEKVASCAGVCEEAILGSDLFLYVREKGKLAGISGELMISPRLDDLECVFASMEAFLAAEPEKTIPVLAVFDNEEVGSHTKQGAGSTFLADVLSRAGEALGKTGSAYLQMLAGSFMISADNAHGVHPNHPEKADT